jgi:phenylacetate-CoA oxygenase PaaJ subunit
MDVERLWNALREVQDPEIPISVVDMGLIVAITEHDGVVHVKLTFTAMGCPATDMIMDDIRERLLREPGVHAVDIEIVWSPAWTSARLSTEGKQALLEMGIAV